MSLDKNRNIFRTEQNGKTLFSFFLHEDYVYFCPFDLIQSSTPYEDFKKIGFSRRSRYAAPAF